MRQIAIAWALLGGEPDPQADDPALAEATAAFEAERWAEAADAFARAYARDPQPKYLYGRAQALRFDGDCEAAIGVYEQFIAESPSDEADAYARDAVALCERELAQREPPPPEPAPEPAPIVDAPAPPADRVAPRAWIRDRVGHGLLWPGVGLGIAGAVMIAVAHQRADTADAAGSERRYREALDRASALHVAGITTLAVGGALLLAGTIRFAVVGHRDRRRSTALAPGALVVRF